MRLLIDLYLKKISRPDLSTLILNSIEEIFKGEDPEVIVLRFKGEEFEMKIDDIDTNLYLAQLFFAEQAINWRGRSKFDLPQLFLLGYIRMVFESDTEIDKICWNAVRNPPPKKYTKYPQ